MRRAFTLIELLVTVAVIGLLLALLAPSLVAARAEGRRGVCVSNLRQLGLATVMYLDDNNDYFWRYYVDIPKPDQGRCWWFGFEPNGPATSAMNRPLDKSRGALARYLRSTDAGLQCPEFPYDSGCYFPKFAGRSASYGYNLNLGPPKKSRPTRRRKEYASRTWEVFVFADGAHWDFSVDRMNEAAYIDYVPDPTKWMGGYAHFRHRGRAEVLYMDGHVEGQRLRGPAFSGCRCAGLAGNLTDPGGGHRVYGESE